MTVRSPILQTGVVLCLAGCGVPTGGEPSVVPASDVPYGLATPTPTDAAPLSVEPLLASSQVYLLGEGDQLIARPREADATGSEEGLEALLTSLADGPTGSERDEQLSTALPPNVRLTVDGLSGGTATVDLDVPDEAPSGLASRRAVAQIVLTATSVPGVDGVLLTLAGEPVEAPLPSGQLTSAPLTALDFTEFLIPAESSEPPPSSPATSTPEPS